MIVGCGLVVLSALSALPLFALPTDGAVTGPELVGAAGSWWAGFVLVPVAVAAVVAVGAWLLAGPGPTSRRRGGAVAVLALAGPVAAVGVVITVLHLLWAGSWTPAGSPGTLGSGWWIALLGIAGALVGAIVERTGPVAAAGPDAPPRSLRTVLGPATLYATLVALVLATSMTTVRDGTSWSRGILGAQDTRSASASCFIPYGTDAYGAPFEYPAQNAVDGHIDSAWRCEGDGVGQQLHIDLGRWTVIHEVGIVPGFAKTDPKTLDDRYAQNRRISAVSYAFDGGASVQQKLDTGVSNRLPQVIALPAVQTRRVTITILASVPGAPTDPKLRPTDRIAISEVTCK